MSNQTADLLRRAKARLQRKGWYQGSCGHPDGANCLWATVVRESRVGLEEVPECYSLECTHALDLLRAEVGSSVPGWNDVKGRTIDEVYALLDQTIEVAEAEAA